MHIADALLSPVVGGTMWAVTAGITAYSAKKLKDSPDDSRIPLMGVLGAFIFAAQMINFSIPVTGSSGHLGGGMILAILLGPYSAFIVLASVLVVQALFFADGGILALGCNIFNMAFFPCFLTYPFMYRKITGQNPTYRKILIGATLSAVIALQLGAFSVVLETMASGISGLPFNDVPMRRELPMKKVLAGFVVAALFTGGILSWFASGYPDGLEWSMARTAGVEEFEAPAEGTHAFLAGLQEKLAFLPDYGFRQSGAAALERLDAEEETHWPAVDPGTTVSGFVGGGLTLLLAIAAGLLLRKASGRFK